MRTTLYTVGSRVSYKMVFQSIVFCAFVLSFTFLSAQSVSLSEGLQVVEQSPIGTKVGTSCKGGVKLVNGTKYLVEGMDSQGERYQFSFLLERETSYKRAEKHIKYYIKNLKGPYRYVEDHAKLDFILTEHQPQVEAVEEETDSNGKVITKRVDAKDEVAEVAITFDSLLTSGFAYKDTPVAYRVVWNTDGERTLPNDPIVEYTTDTVMVNKFLLANHFRKAQYSRKRQFIFGARGSIEASFMRSYANVAQFNKQEQLDVRKGDNVGVGFTVGGFVGMTGRGGSGFYVSADYWRHDVELAGDGGANLFTGLPVGVDEAPTRGTDKYVKFHSVLVGLNYFYTSRSRRTKPIFEMGAYYQYNMDNENEPWQGDDNGRIINNHFGFSTGLGISFRYFKAADFSLIPTFRYTFTSFNPDADIASNNFGFGLKAQLTFMPCPKRW